MALKSKLSGKFQCFNAINGSIKMLKKIPFPKISIKMKNCKTFYFKVLQECSSWASRGGAVQMFFLTPNKNMLAKTFVKSESILAVLRENIIFNVQWVEFRKMREVFWVKLYCKMSDFLSLVIVGFETFCQEIWILKKSLIMFSGTCWRIWKSCIPKIIFSEKKFPNMRFWIIYILVQISILVEVL